MKRVAIVLGFVLAGGWLTMPAQADCVRARCVKPTVVAETVVTPAVVATFVPIVVAVPTYSVTIAAPIVPVTPTAPVTPAPGPTPTPNPGTPKIGDAPLDQVKALQDEIARLRAELDACKKQIGKPVQAPVPIPQEPTSMPKEQGTAPVLPKPPAAIVNAATKCFACHSEASATKEGGGFVMFQGNALKAPGDFPPGKQVKLLTKAYLGQMPPKGNKQGIQALTDEEVSAWQSYFAGK